LGQAASAGDAQGRHWLENPLSADRHSRHLRFNEIFQTGKHIRTLIATSRFVRLRGARVFLAHEQ
jgi:hypothetical protein